jgi:hypothetical protein
MPGKGARKIQRRLAAIVSLQKGKNHIHPITEAAATQRRRCVGGKFRRHPSQVQEGPSPPNTSRQACPSRRQSHSRQESAAAPATVDQPGVQTSLKWQKAAGQSAPAQIVNSLPLNNIVRVVTVVQQFMTEHNDAMPKEAKIQAIYKLVLTLLEQKNFFKKTKFICNL